MAGGRSGLVCVIQHAGLVQMACDAFGCCRVLFGTNKSSLLVAQRRCPFAL